MATNKNALIRYKVLDNCFRNPGRRYFITDLIAACNKVLMEMDPDFGGISRRQILDDIAFMEAAEGWSVQLDRHRDGKKVYYRYSDPAFSINNMPLNEIEISQLKSAIDILSQFKGMPQFEWMNELVPKLQQGAVAEETKVVIDFDNNHYLKGIEHLGPLYSSIIYKKVLKISYQPFDSDQPHNLTLHPYYLKQYNNRWFLFGYNPERNKYDWNLALDRIVSIDETKGKYQKNEEIDWSEYFEDIIGVTKPIGNNIETVVLQFSERSGKYIESKPLHGSQKSRWIESNRLEVSLELMINYELERLILSYADSVLVIMPIKLQEQVKTRLTEAVSKY